MKKKYFEQFLQWKILPNFQKIMLAMLILGISFVPVFPIQLFKQTLIYCNTHSFHEERKRRRKKKRERDGERDIVLSKILKCLFYFSDLNMGYILSSKC